MSEDTQLTPEEAYVNLLKLYDSVKVICQEMEKQEKYSPFTYLPSKMKSELKDIRTKLIEAAVREHTRKYMPNAKPGADFMKLMDERAGELGFRKDVIEAWFRDETANKQQLTEKSFQHITTQARNLLPYVYGKDGYGGACRDPQHILKGEMIELRAYTWRSASSYVPGSISYNLNSRGEFQALEKLIELVTLPGRDAATVRARAWITDHIYGTRNNPSAFYGKHTVSHACVKAFQFFKNNKMKIWFKTKEQAQAVAETLVSGTLPKAPLTLVT